ncbi:MAG TPA: ankyrin repeat domain-containing protein [Vicinamibacterales bacterium]|nr:ankyrin repeat domain-containing protein [Vicinamibacterales bacterium]
MASRRVLKRLIVGLVVCTAVVSAQDGGPSGDALYSAIRANDLARLQAMLDGGTDVNAGDQRGGSTLLMHAAAAGSVESMKLLIDRKANVNAVNSAGATALMMAVTDIDKVRLLLTAGADVNVATKRGRTALLLAALSDRSAPIVRLLVASGASTKAVDVLKVTALGAATIGGDLETIQMMVDAGVPVDSSDFAGFTPLMNAAFGGNLAAVRLLLSKGANVNAVSTDGSFQKVKAGTIALGNFTPLLGAASMGSPEMIRTLLEAGANINARDVRGMTPLMLAVATDRQNAAVIRLLVDRKADVNLRSLAGETALDWARKIGNPAVITTLERAGAVASSAEPAARPAFAPADMTTSVRRSLALLEKSSAQAAANGGCASCHHHNITDIATSVAQKKGIAIDEKAAADRRQLTRARFFAPMTFFERLETGGFPDVEIYALSALGASSQEPDRNTDAVVASLLARQRADGSWSLGGIARPPIEDGDIFRTALAITVIKAFGPPGRAEETSRRLSEAKSWLERAHATTAEDRSMQLVGLECMDAGDSTLRKLAKTILAAQRADGGWAQNAFLSSDAYATGQTLASLAKTGMLKPGDPVYQRALKYLLSTQSADGSWYVRSRSPKFQPFFESGFPYGHDQWISAMATGWAATAVAMALP